MIETSNAKTIVVTAILVTLAQVVTQGIYERYSKPAEVLPEMQYQMQALKNEVMSFKSDVIELRNLVEKMAQDRDNSNERQSEKDRRFQDSVMTKLDAISNQLTEVKSDVREHTFRIAQNTKDLGTLTAEFNVHRNQKKHWSDVEKNPGG